MIVLLIHSPLLPSTSCSLPQAPLCVAAFKGSGMIVEEMLKQPNIRVSTVCSYGGVFFLSESYNKRMMRYIWPHRGHCGLKVSLVYKSRSTVQRVH